MRIDCAKLGAGMLASGPILTSVVGGGRVVWWIGLVFTVLGPVMMALKCGRKKE